MQTPTVRHWALLGYLVFFWGFAFGLIAMALEAFHPVAVVWSRLTLGAVVMLLVLRLHGVFGLFGNQNKLGKNNG